MLQERF
jgi:hypothetical protein